MGLNAAQIRIRALTYKKLFIKRYKRFPILLQDADDFEQHCLETMWRKQNTDLRFMWLATNFIESLQCSARNRIRDSLILKSENEAVTSSNKTSFDSVFVPAPRSAEVLAFFEPKTIEELHSIGLDTIDKSIVMLTLKWGFRFKEIADLYGISQSAISLRLKKIKGVVKAHQLS